MPAHPRRTLLSGLSSAVVVAAAGCLSFADEDTDDTPDDETDGGDDPFSPLLAAVPDEVVTEAAALSAVDEARLRAADAQTVVGAVDLTHRTRVAELFGDDAAAVSKHVAAFGSGEDSSFVVVFEPEADDFDPASDFEVPLETELTARERETGPDYEFASAGDDTIVAMADGIGFVADTESTITAALDAREGNADAIREASPVFDDALEAFGDADALTITTADEWSWAYDQLDPEDGRYVALTATVVDSKTIEIGHGLELVDESLVTDDLIEQFEGGAVGGEETAFDTAVDGALLRGTETLDLETERRNAAHESPSGLSPGELAIDEEYVEIEVIHGDPTPVDELTLVLDGEPYDEAIWADGQDEIEGGDTILIRTDDAEPNLPITLRHETDYGTTAETKLYSEFGFAFDYDLAERTVTVRYEDEYPLDGDSVIVAVRDADGVHRSDSEPLERTTPWTGSELSTGDEATVEGVDPGTVVLVGWESDTFRESLARERIRPPGTATVDYEYETRTATVELAFTDEQTRPAAEYTLLRNDEAAATQWDDDGESVADGDALELEDVAVGTRISVVWGDDERRIGGGVARPAVSFDLTVDDGTVTLVHKDGPALPASELVATVHVDDDETDVALGERIEGSFAPGDTVALLDLERDDPPLKVRVQYDGTQIEDAYDGEL